MVLHGIDISAWQPDFDPARVATDFVIIKATGGPGYVNDAWARQYDAARAAGKRVGLYHFVRDGWKNTTAEDEADHFISTVGARADGALLVLDWEADNVADVGWATRWLDRVTDEFGTRPVIYTGLHVANTYDWSRVAKNHPLWLAWYWNNDPVNGYSPPGTQPTVNHWGRPAIWQYTQHGRLPGYNGGLDLNIAYEDLWVGEASLLIPDLEGVFKP